MGFRWWELTTVGHACTSDFLIHSPMGSDLSDSWFLLCVVYMRLIATICSHFASPFIVKIILRIHTFEDYSVDKKNPYRSVKTIKQTLKINWQSTEETNQNFVRLFCYFITGVENASIRRSLTLPSCLRYVKQSLSLCERRNNDLKDFLFFNSASPAWCHRYAPFSDLKPHYPLGEKSVCWPQYPARQLAVF